MFLTFYFLPNTHPFQQVEKYVRTDFFQNKKKFQ